MGVFEFENFAKGTIAVAKAMADSRCYYCNRWWRFSAAAVNQLGFGDKMTHISTGGGASLEFLEGKVLPGIEALITNKFENNVSISICQTLIYKYDTV